MPLSNEWIIQGDATQLGAEPAPPLGLLPLTTALLSVRGLSRAEQQADFLLQTGPENLSDFSRLPGMAEAVQAVLRAVEEKKKICIYGDYDADGMTATALLLRALEVIGGEADFYIPHRLREGYGLHREAIRQIRERGAAFLITVDCGVSDAEEAAYAKSLGLTLVVTDHHRLPDVLPDAAALVNPELMPEPGKSKGMSGAGVAFALACCLFRQAGREADLSYLLQLAAIGTLADGMPLLGDNRILVTQGLLQINIHPLPGIVAMIRQAGLEGKTIGESQVVFSIAPRLNAAGRMDDPALAMALLTAEDIPAANPYVLRLETLNKQRQETDGTIYREAVAMLEADATLAARPVLILAGEGWHQGVVGITAARLMDRYHKPVILVSFEGDIGKGSGRSQAGFHLYQALSGASHLLLAFGGHAQACGLQIARDQFASFCANIEAYALLHASGDPKEGRAAALVDLAVRADQLTLAAVEELERLAPFGPANPKPAFALFGMALTEMKPMGQEKRHYQLFFRAPQTTPDTAGYAPTRPAAYSAERQTAPPSGALPARELTAVAFSLEETLFLPQVGETYDILCQPEINEWQGRRSVRVLLRDLRESRTGTVPGETLPPDGDIAAASDRKTNRLSGRDETETVMPTRSDVVLPNSPAALPDRGVVDWTLYRESILGGRDFRDKQIEALDALAQGKNTMLLMATGRGKTAVFQTAIAALNADKITIILYPLRSLARDQLQRMEKIMGPLGFRTALAWGGLDQWEKRTFFNDLYQGRIRLVLSTAEFLQAHLDRFKAVADRIGLFIVDEAHHLGETHRQAYKDLYQTWKKLGNPLLLAATATADDDVADRIIRDFNITNLTMEEHCRENLAIVDARGSRGGDTGGSSADSGAGGSSADSGAGGSDADSGGNGAGGSDADSGGNRADGGDNGADSGGLGLGARGRGGDSADKLAYLLATIDPAGKTIVYVNSRALTEELAHVLQDNLPDMKNTIGYYHGGLQSEARRRAEHAFLSGDCRLLVSTSAFGEGADIPDIRDVMLYHLCFSAAEFNQLSGRAGRDGAPARIHLLYHKSDLELNRMLLREEAPDRDALGSFYLCLREKASVRNPLSLSDADLAEEMQKRGYAGFSARTAGFALGILEEIDLLLREEEGGRRDIHLAPPPPAKLDLKQSALFMEGQKSVFLFEDYIKLAFSADGTALLAGVNRPILPERRRNIDDRRAAYS